jgi:catalase
MAKKTLTTDKGVVAGDYPHSLTIGQRGPVLFQDVRQIEKQVLTL